MEGYVEYYHSSALLSSCPVVFVLAICSFSFSSLSGEANLFEEALQKYGKDFTDIQKDFVSSA